MLMSRCSDKGRASGKLEFLNALYCIGLSFFASRWRALNTALHFYAVAL